MAERTQSEQTPSEHVNVNARLRAALRRGAVAGLHTLLATSVVAVAGLIVMDVACTWFVHHNASDLAAAVNFAFTGFTSILLAAYVVAVRAVGRGVRVGNEQAQLGALVLEVTLSSVTTAPGRGVVGADRVRSAAALARTAVDQLKPRIDGNVLVQWASLRVLRLTTRLVGVQVAETLVANRGDLGRTALDLSDSMTARLDTMVARWMRVQTLVACAIAVAISLLVAALLALA
jgi:hypothetical protein